MATSSKIARLWADRIESGERKLSECPAKLLAEVTAIILADGYIIDEDGNVIPPNQN